MKKQTMSLAVASALLLGGSGAFGNMYLNERGTGEALIYPYFSAANGNDTYIHVVNTTGLVKAVKVRFLEAQNSVEVLDFNLYLSPFDEWTGAITQVGDGGAIRTNDNSCTVPSLGQPNNGFDGTTVVEDDGTIIRTQPFVNFEYLEDAPNSNIARTLQGYVEIIEMGQLVSTVPVGWPFDAATLALWLADNTSDKGWAATHDTAGVPNGCEKLVGAWGVAPGGSWTNSSGADELLATWNGGGLYGLGTLINVADGTAVGYDAVAIDAFADPILVGQGDLHEEPGDVRPNWEDGDSSATLFIDGVSADVDMTDGIDAVSALLMSDTLSNDFIADAGRRSRTDWVITQPTKRFYVDTIPATSPYTDSWDGNEACEVVTVAFWNREELFTEITEGPGFSPRPPSETPDDFTLCTEVSVVGFGVDSAVRATDDIFYGFNGFLGDVTEGWARMDLSDTGHFLDDDTGTVRFIGLPVTGFAVFTLRNDDADDAVAGVLAAYSSASRHKSTDNIGAAPAPTP